MKALKEGEQKNVSLMPNFANSACFLRNLSDFSDE